MCGIAGQVRADGAPVEPDLLASMCAAIEHRGPDSRGVHVDGGVGLGIQRLAVIDLATGDQPIFNEDGSIVVVLNGEIYNYRELRVDLECRGHRFSTRSDTEVIVHLYEEHGRDCVRWLHGMFAFALWDSRTRTLLLSRDRVGKKPLLYAHRGGALTFGSELGALMRDPEVSREVDAHALDAYLAYRCVPGPLTAFRSVRKLPPGSTLVLREGRIGIERYWRLTDARRERREWTAEVREELWAQIRRAVERRMVADVPLGAFLSGGIDSAAVVAAMAECSPQPVKTFSIGFEGDEYDELPLARLVATRFGTDHHEFLVEPQATDLLPRIVEHYGEPFADPSAIPTFCVAEVARRHVTVALNGDGGDESFGGYTRYISNLALHRAGRMPAPVRRAVAAACGLAPESGRINSWPSRLRRFAGAMALDPASRHARYLSEYKGGLDRSRLYTPEYRELLNGASPVVEKLARVGEESSAGSCVDLMMEFDIESYLPDDLLVKMDIATMAHSLEARSPFLDHELMEYATGLPPRAKIRGRQTKAGLREVLRGRIPDAVLDAPKRGFRAPIADWLRGPLEAHAREVLLDRATLDRGHFSGHYLEELLNRHVGRREDHSQAIWSLLILEMWHRRFVDRAAVAASA
jgi:asparagine synthase (glutamine-hydrolysing)